MFQWLLLKMCPSSIFLHMEASKNRWWIVIDVRFERCGTVTPQSRILLSHFYLNINLRKTCVLLRLSGRFSSIQTILRTKILWYYRIWACFSIVDDAFLVFFTTWTFSRFQLFSVKLNWIFLVAIIWEISSMLELHMTISQTFAADTSHVM